MRTVGAIEVGSWWGWVLDRGIGSAELDPDDTEQRAQTLAHDSVVVDQEHSRRHRDLPSCPATGSKGATSVTRVPFPDPDSMSIRPPR